MTACRAARTAALRPTERFPGAEIARMRGSRSARARRRAIVASVEPPSATTISSGGRVPSSNESRRASIDPSSFRTVTMRLTGSRLMRTGPRARPRSPAAGARLGDGVGLLLELVLLEVLEPDGLQGVRRDRVHLRDQRERVVHAQPEQVRARPLERAARVRREEPQVGADGVLLRV